jgi:hypothetical protein
MDSYIIILRKKLEKDMATGVSLGDFYGLALNYQSSRMAMLYEDLGIKGLFQEKQELEEQQQQYVHNYKVAKEGLKQKVIEATTSEFNVNQVGEVLLSKNKTLAEQGLYDEQIDEDVIQKVGAWALKRTFEIYGL